MGGHHVRYQPAPVEERSDVGAVSEEELQSVGVGGLHGLRDIDEVELVLVPQHVVLTEVSVDQVAVLIHALHGLNRGEFVRRVIIIMAKYVA